MDTSAVSSVSAVSSSAAASGTERVVEVLKKQQDVAKQQGEALVALITESLPDHIGSQISEYA